MKEVQNKVDEAKKLNDELKKELEGYDSETKEEFQGYEVKEEKPEKKKQKKKLLPKESPLKQRKNVQINKFMQWNQLPIKKEFQFIGF